MKNTLFLVLFVLLTTAFFSISAEEIIQMQSSNTSLTSEGFYLNEYDYLIQPSYIGELSKPSFFFAMDESLQVGSSDTGNPRGFRAGWFSGKKIPGFVLDYDMGRDITTAEEEDNITLDYNNYDQATGTYASIEESVDKFLKDANPDYELLFHTALPLSESFGIAAQVLWEKAVLDVEEISYTNTYQNTTSTSTSTLTNKGNRTHSENTLLTDDGNTLALDLEAGIATDKLRSEVSIGAAMENVRREKNVDKTTTTEYSSGSDATKKDLVTITEYQGQYYENGSRQTSFNMTGSDTSYLSGLKIGLDTDTRLALENFTLLISAGSSYTMPLGELETKEVVTTKTYDDTDDSETNQTINITKTEFTPDLDLNLNVGLGIEKVFQPAENASVTLGPLFQFSMDMENNSRVQTKTTATKTDNNGNNNYTDAGVDVDTLYIESGYEYQVESKAMDFDLSLPIGIEWTPVKLFTFHAGYYMKFNYSLDTDNELTTGSNNFLYEEYKDNLVSANSYKKRQKDTSNNENTPTIDTTHDFSYIGSGSFGLAVHISEDLLIDMRATTGNNVSFDQFSVMAVMSY